MHNKTTLLKILSTMVLFITSLASLALPLKVEYLYKSSIQPIPAPVAAEMEKFSWWPRCPVGLDQLAYVTLTHWGFDQKKHQGVLIVNRKVAQEVVSIFKELFMQHFPIESIEPRYSFGNNAFTLLLSNSSAGFMCRSMVGNSNKYSLHSYGLAIDINPGQNPYIKGNVVIPWLGLMYVARHHKTRGMIMANDAVVHAFQKRGWTWGGDWRTRKDYMHFQKKIY